MTDRLSASPVSILRAMRGLVERANFGYPQILLLDIRDDRGALWRFATQDADWSPTDPAVLLGRALDDIEIEPSGKLVMHLSGGVRLNVVPGDFESDDDPPYWELITPDGLALEFGPRFQWLITDADARPVQSGALEP